MVRITRADVSLMDRPKRTGTAAKQLTPAQQERQRQQRQFTRLMGQLTDTDAVFEVRLGKEDKSVTVRQRLLRAAEEAGKEVAVRRSPRGFAVGLMTPERRSRRGRKKASASA